MQVVGRETLGDKYKTTSVRNQALTHGDRKVETAKCSSKQGRGSEGVFLPRVDRINPVLAGGIVREFLKRQHI